MRRLLTESRYFFYNFDYFFLGYTLLTLAPNNFEPQTGSPAIKAAATGYAVYDFSGKKRSGTPTIGAIEIK
jgi:hypothetical protein